jgi:dTDP-4-dehydrorhamnose reductase
LRRLLPDAVACTRIEADLARPETLHAAVRRSQPDVVFNCGAYNAVDQAESDPAGVFAVNALGVRELALACRAAGATLVHYSTNYVFGQDESRRVPYEATDLPGPVSAYGISKLAGEHFARALCPDHLVIRTCGLFGFLDRPSAPWNFIEKLLARARRGERLRVVNDQVCTPTPVDDLAQASLELWRAGARGLVHFTAQGACTWHEFACAALRLAKVDAHVEAVTSDAFAAPAQRPRYSVMACGSYDALGLTPRTTWQTGLERYFNSARTS